MRFVEILGLCLTALAPLSAGCAADTADDSASSEDAILGGNAEPGQPSVGMFRRVVSLDANGKVSEVFTCTATVIAPGVLLTAAHCTEPRDTIWSDVSFSEKPDIGGEPGQGWAPATIIRHPKYQASTRSIEGHDVAIVLCPSLREAGPPVVRRRPTPAAGAEVLAVGYGRTAFVRSDTDGRNQKRSVRIPIAEVKEHELVAGTEGSGTCKGDSGGPLLLGGAIVAVTSYGASDCHGRSHYMRLDDNLDFIHKYAPLF